VPSTWSQEKYITALRYAAAAHNGQKLPGTDLPYLVHVTMVAMEVIAALAREDGLSGDLAVQCALLHDVIEDGGKSCFECSLFKRSGDDWVKRSRNVYFILSWLTD
jgi:(p)ppGpp synthase/HD superfamily hydrolase